MNKLNDYLFNTDIDDIDHIIADYIKNNLDDIPSMTIDEIAGACFVSKAKISKFCKKLGYENFIAFKDECITDSSAKKIVIENINKDPDSSYYDHLRSSFENILNGLNHTDHKQIDKLAILMNQASYIYVYGIAYSNLLARYLQCECDFIDKKVIVLDEKLNKDIPIHKDSILILFSIDGHCFDHDSRLIRKLSRFTMKKWLISTDKANKYIKYFDDHITIPAYQNDMRDRRLLVRYVIDILIGRYKGLFD